MVFLPAASLSMHKHGLQPDLIARMPFANVREGENGDRRAADKTSKIYDGGGGMKEAPC